MWMEREAGLMPRSKQKKMKKQEDKLKWGEGDQIQSLQREKAVQEEGRRAREAEALDIHSRICSSPSHPS